MSTKRRRGRLTRETRERAFNRWAWCCAACGRPAQHAHHVFAKSRYPELVDEADNIVPLCVDHHADHESAKRRIPRWTIRLAERLAVTPQMENYLDRIYGPKGAT